VPFCDRQFGTKIFGSKSKSQNDDLKKANMIEVEIGISSEKFFCEIRNKSIDLSYHIRKINE
jgi:hypothetical protein